MSFGLNLTRQKNGRILVRNVPEGGSVADWNEQYPMRDIVAGDRVLAVNGAIARTAWQAWCTATLVSNHVNLIVIRSAARPFHPSNPSIDYEEYLKSLEGDLSSAIGNTCAICLEELNDAEDTVVLPCRHAFHHDCAGAWLQKCGTLKAARCPTCREAPHIATGQCGKSASLDPPDEAENANSAQQPLLVEGLVFDI